jgi:hypothetical protein
MVLILEIAVGVVLGLLAFGYLKREAKACRLTVPAYIIASLFRPMVLIVLPVAVVVAMWALWVFLGGAGHILRFACAFFVVLLPFSWWFGKLLEKSNHPNPEITVSEVETPRT